MNEARAKKHVGELIATEALATLGSVLLYPFGISHRPRSTARRAEQRTLVFVHGYLANRSCLLPMATYLAAKGHSSQLAYQYSAGDCIEKAAIGLKKFLKKHVRGGRIDLVCHSLGGLVARCYLQELGGARRVDHCVTLGTPHRGTYNAYWIWSRVGQQLRPESLMMERLAKTVGAAKNVRFISILGSADTIVLPRVAAGHELEQIVVPDIGHLGILFSPAVFRLVHDRLQRPSEAQSPQSKFGAWLYRLGS